MKTITEELLNRIKNATDIQEFLNSCEKDFINKSCSQHLNEIMEAKKLSASFIANNSGIGEYVYKILKGERNPSRDVLISIAFGMGLTLEETQFLLRISKFAVLDSREKRDSIIIYSLTHKKNVYETDDLLDNNNIPTLL